MATFPLHIRHIAERAMSEKFQRILDRELGIDRHDNGRPRAAGDRDVLRGIPVAGVPGGHGGAIRDTRPDSALDWKVATSDEAA